MTEELVPIATSTELVRITKETLLHAGREGLKELPFVASVLAVFAGVYQGVNAARFQTFLEGVGKPLGCGDFKAAADYVAENIEKPWVRDGIEKGWKAVLEATDPLARECLTLMVADYMAKKETPDRFHRQFCNFFMESDAATLAMTLRISNWLNENDTDYVRIIIGWRKEAIAPIFSGDGPTAKPVNLPRSEIQLFHYDDKNYGAILFPLDDFREAWDVLRRNSLVSPWVGDPLVHPHPQAFEVDELIGIIDERQVKRWERMRQYIAPLEDAILFADHERRYPKEEK
jgi:hypothetical protein